MLFQTEQEKNENSHKKENANSVQSERKSKFLLKRMEDAAANYIDYDQVQNSQQGTPEAWISAAQEPKEEETGVKDYRTELELYRGSSPESEEEKTKNPKKKRGKKKKRKKKLTEKGKIKRDKFLKEVAHRIVCTYFKQGYCYKGADCAYSHVLPKKLPALCKFSFYRDTFSDSSDVKHNKDDSPPFHLSSSPFHLPQLDNYTHPSNHVKVKESMSEDDSADGHELKIALPERIPSGSQISLGCFSHEPIAFKVKTDDCNTICDSGRERLSSPSNFNDENPLESFSKLPSAMPTCPIPDTTKGFMQCERNRNSSKLIESEVSESSPETLAQNSLSSFNACQPGHVEIKSERSLVEQQSSTLPPCPSSLENFMMETESKFLLPKVIEKSHSHPNAYAEGGRSAPVIAQTEEKKQTANRFPFQPFVPQKDKKDNPDLGKPFSENVVGGHPRPPMIETAPEEGPLNGSPAASGTSESASVVDKVAGDRALSSEILGVTAKTDVVMAAECSAIETQGALCNNLLKNHVNNESTKPLGKKRIKKTKKNQGKNKNQNAPKKSSCPIQENPWIDNKDNIP
ncbi:uncharacterized protein LOC129224297 [Uloborus diversus]|uniref:uncharacterized protein LOC129224297 n=1 Tax=Uloborus diversus TaxID=327109 RepID=UPI002408FDD9|nr:uncharacterized protein LOC129224297 [Uloborus diversus]